MTEPTEIEEQQAADAFAQHNITSAQQAAADAQRARELAEQLRAGK